ncbi:MAG: S-layer homology domain-containing protein [Aeriscardovia sp.]|nr:S-layer homology domain-containing protein [Aeriscardovia sp.]
MQAIQWGQEAGVIKGYDDNTFRPKEDCLRKHIVTFFYRYAREVLKENVN